MSVHPIRNSEVDRLTVSFQSPETGKRALCYKVCVIVPVRNEARYIRETLEALRVQTDLHGKKLPRNAYEVLVLVNNSTDESFQLAKQYAGDFPDFPVSMAEIVLDYDQAHIGTVRRLLMDEAYRRLTRSGNHNGIIASTDGDTMVDEHWVAQIIAEIRKGNDAVGGRILTKRADCDGRAFHLRDVTYRCLLAQAECLIDPQVHNPYPCHHQYFGANMAVTAKMYAQAGKLPVLRCLEDVAFHKALVGQDAKIRNSFEVKVYTSSRTDGRVDIGFSEQLRKWQHEEKLCQTQMVEEVSMSLHLFYARHLLRDIWHTYQTKRMISHANLEQAAHMLQIDPDWVRSTVPQTAYFGQFWNTVLQVASENGNMTFQPIRQAIAQLRSFIQNPELTVFQKSPAGKFRRGHFANVSAVAMAR